MCDNKDGMVRPSDDGVHIEAPTAQTGSSSVGVPSATSGNTPYAASPTENSIPGPTSIDDTKEAELASEQPVSAARSAGATTSRRPDQGNGPVATSPRGRGPWTRSVVFPAWHPEQSKHLRAMQGRQRRPRSENVPPLRPKAGVP